MSVAWRRSSLKFNISFHRSNHLISARLRRACQPWRRLRL